MVEAGSFQQELLGPHQANVSPAQPMETDPTGQVGDKREAATATEKNASSDDEARAVCSTLDGLGFRTYYTPGASLLNYYVPPRADIVQGAMESLQQVFLEEHIGAGGRPWMLAGDANLDTQDSALVDNVSMLGGQLVPGVRAQSSRWNSSSKIDFLFTNHLSSAGSALSLPEKVSDHKALAVRLKCRWQREVSLGILHTPDWSPPPHVPTDSWRSLQASHWKAAYRHHVAPLFHQAIDVDEEWLAFQRALRETYVAAAQAVVLAPPALSAEQSAELTQWGRARQSFRFGSLGGSPSFRL